MGQWIGGDRDGNPNVGADTLALALRRQAEVALRHYLTEVHTWARAVAVSKLVEVTPERGWPSARPTPASTARRALPPRADRHLRAPGRHAARADRRRGRAPRRRAAGAYASAEEFLADLRTSTPRCARTTAPRWRRAPAPLMRAVEVFGFHLATVDLRQARTSTSAWWPSCWPRRASSPTTPLDEAQRRALLLGLLNDARARCVPAPTASTRGELAIFETAAQVLRRYGRAPPSATTSSATPRRSATCWRCCCCKEVGLLRGTLDTEATPT
jgi:phosphoenolpyruvate carboxylase